MTARRLVLTVVTVAAIALLMMSLHLIRLHAAAEPEGRSTALSVTTPHDAMPEGDETDRH
jgi:hypothetical protein